MKRPIKPATKRKVSKVSDTKNPRVGKRPPLETRSIKCNKAQCNSCGDIIESTHRHDFRWCGCGALAVDGGQAYLKRSFDRTKPPFTELTEYHND